MAGNKVLIVEDDANLLEILKYNLRKEGYDVVTASDGEQAIEVARREKPDLHGPGPEDDYTGDTSHLGCA
jgi:CheY-like chemotaxis protein